MINPAALAYEIANDPAALGYAGFLPDSPGVVCDLINEIKFSMPQTRLICDLGVMEKYADGAIAADLLLSRIEAFSETAHPLAGVVKRTLPHFHAARFDIGAAGSQAMFDMLAQAAVITADEAAKMKALGNKQASRAEVLFGANTVVTLNDLREAGVI